MTMCALPECCEPADVIVSDPTGDEAPLCRDHWHEADRRSRGLIRAVRLVRDEP